MATFVLVHGAFVGGWCWQWVTPILTAAGHRVVAPTLIGLGDRAELASPRIDLDTHVDEIAAVMKDGDMRDVILVGWSYGGMVVAGAADRAAERITHIVYLDSDVPRDGDTSVPPSRIARRIELASLHGDGWRVPAAALGVDALLLGELAPERRAWIAERLAPHPLATWTQPLRLTGAAADVPTTYVRCIVGSDPSDEDTRRQDERVRGEPAWSYRELSASHAAPFNAPSLVAKVLLEIAGRAVT